MKKISKKIEKTLEEGKIKHEIFHHKTTYTAFDKAATTAKQKIKSAEIVKTLVMKADNDCLLALISANKMLDKSKLKKIVNFQIKKEADVLKKAIRNEEDKKRKKEMERELKKKKACKRIDFAKEAWMKKNIQGKIGAVPPFSGIVKLPIFVDGTLLRQKQLYLGSGEYELSIKMTPAQYQKLEKDLIKGSFSKAKKK